MPTVRCPHCGAERNTPSSKLPAKKSSARCPECCQTLIFDPAESQRTQTTDNIATCPHCGLQRRIPSDRLEIQSKTVNCRRCNRSFCLQPEREFRASGSGLRSISQLLADSWELFCRRGWGLLGIYLLGIVLAFAPIFSALLLKPATWLNPQNQNWQWAILLATVAYILLGLSWMTGSMFIYICKTDVGLFRSMKLGLRHVGSFTLLLILLILVVGGGSLLLIIPGLLFCVWFFFCQYVLADDNIGGLQALEKSRLLVSGHWWAIFGRFVLLLVISLTLSFLTARIPYVGEAANLAFSLLLTPFSFLYYYLIYSDLKANYRGPQHPPIKRQWLPLTAAIFGWMLIPGLLLVSLSRQNLSAEQLLSAGKDIQQRLGTQPQQTPDLNRSLPEEPQRLSSADYKLLLSKQRKTTSEGGLSLGPVTLFADRFWADDQNPHLWLKLELSDFPNLSLAQKGSARIEIDKVLDDDARDLYDRQHSFEHPAFHWVGINQTDENDLFSGIRSIYLRQGTQAEQVHSILGKLELTLPLAIESLQLTRNDIGKTLQIGGKQLILQRLGSNAVTLRFLGDRTDLLNVHASNSHAEPLREIGFTWQKSGDAFSLRQMFDGNIESITVLVAGDSMTQSYPFELTR
ncbi:MJ0042 family finger-like domain-containing protein [Malonomonas rubra DSM 5091]|uniref:MJ0042 family finger-like domain-containing protein n=1 Tax=Malonomonas rubra DSM 5091 TaxID=1122189 RepID=A0A1M6I6D4_MALRU|nr:hypothetical protein [Malonomonas rubra]SHJ30007.1 MJ0042 family finger-like domain-containing protein [Malonomonas rubra DSM 5091]